MTGAKTLGTYTAVKGKTLAVKVPYGDLGYLRLKWSAAAAQSAGAITAALVLDADIA